MKITEENYTDTIAKVGVEKMKDYINNFMLNYKFK